MNWAYRPGDRPLAKGMGMQPGGALPGKTRDGEAGVCLIFKRLDFPVCVRSIIDSGRVSDRSESRRGVHEQFPDAGTCNSVMP